MRWELRGGVEVGVKREVKREHREGVCYSFKVGWIERVCMERRGCVWSGEGEWRGEGAWRGEEWRG